MIIRGIGVKNFKCFEKLNLELTNLNVLSGINSMGKSTIIQTLLLLRQAYKMEAIKKGIYLNGDLIDLGNGKDILYKDSNEDSITISLVTDAVDQGDLKFQYDWKYKYDADADYLKLSKTNAKMDKIKNINLFSDNFSYISADRIGPRRFYSNSYHDIYLENMVGKQGELFVGFLAERGKDFDVENEAVLNKKSGSRKLISQTSAWLSEISPSIEIDPKKYTEVGLVGIEYNVDGRSYSPVNIGFGVSYVAPIVVSLLKAKKGDLVILENPEAHLHPSGQRKMGELISQAAAGGVQIILETHSDHILNGIRLSVKNKRISKNDVSLFYFYIQSTESSSIVNNYIHSVNRPCINDDGSLSDWPDGFFDEWDKALEELI